MSASNISSTAFYSDTVVMDEIDQRGGIGEDSIMNKCDDLAENDPWVLAAVQQLTKEALECGFWELENLDETRNPPMPHKNHPVWEIVQTKRAELSEGEAIWLRPHWMNAEDSLPCVHWLPNYPLALAAADGGPSSSVPSDVNSDNFEEDEEESRGRRQTPRPHHAASVSVAEQSDGTQGEPESDKDFKGFDKEDNGKEAEGPEGKNSDGNKSEAELEVKDTKPKQKGDTEAGAQAGQQ